MRDDPVKRDLSGVGARVRELRKSKGWTLDQLATDSGISKAFLSLLENEKHQPSGQVALALARSLNASVDYLLRGSVEDEGEPLPQHSIEIPVELATLAAEKGWRLQHVFDLLRAHKALLARRSSRVVRPFTKTQWKEFAERLAPYLSSESDTHES